MEISSSNYSNFFVKCGCAGAYLVTDPQSTESIPIDSFQDSIEPHPRRVVCSLGNWSLLDHMLDISEIFTFQIFILDFFLLFILQFIEQLSIFKENKINSFTTICILVMLNTFTDPYRFSHGRFTHFFLI